jgi:hypothetical protein
MNYEEYTVRVYHNGGIRWFDKEMKLHRENGPAVEWDNGYKEYYKHGILHNLNGFARIFGGGTGEYYIEGKSYSKQIFDKEVARIKGNQEDPFDGKSVELNGVKYKLQKVD